MTETSKRLKKNISFSTHEKDIYDYLNGMDNASAFIKRLVLNHMLMEKGMVAPIVVTTPPKDGNKEVSQRTSNEENKPSEPEQEKEPELSPEDLENQAIAQALDI